MIAAETADNTVYAVRYAHPNCAFGTTSHTPKPLYAIATIIRGDRIVKRWIWRWNIKLLRRSSL